MNHVVFLVSCVGMNVVRHVHILALKVISCIFHSPTLVPYQLTIFLPSMWLLFIYSLVLLSGVGYTPLYNELPQNHQLIR